MTLEQRIYNKAMMKWAIYQDTLHVCDFIDYQRLAFLWHFYVREIQNINPKLPR